MAAVSRGQTTYEFIMNQHKKQQERLRQRRARTSNTNDSSTSPQSRRRPHASDEEAPTAEMTTAQQKPAEAENKEEVPEADAVYPAAESPSKQHSDFLSDPDADV